MEKRFVVPLSEVTHFEYICPDCKKNFARTLDELERWYESSEPRLGERAEPLCSFCGSRPSVIRDVIGKLVDLWKSNRATEVRLRFMV